MYSYKKNYTIHGLSVGLSFDFRHVSILEFKCQIYIICKQPIFIITAPMWGVKWTFIWHFRISMNRITDFVKSSRHQLINASVLYRKIKLPMSWNMHRTNESLGFNKTTQPAGAYGLTNTCVMPRHRHAPWRPMATGIKAVHIAKIHSHTTGRELTDTG